VNVDKFPVSVKAQGFEVLQGDLFARLRLVVESTVNVASRQIALFLRFRLSASTPWPSTPTYWSKPCISQPCIAWKRLISIKKWRNVRSLAWGR